MQDQLRHLLAVVPITAAVPPGDRRIISWPWSPHRLAALIMVLALITSWRPLLRRIV